QPEEPGWVDRKLDLHRYIPLECPAEEPRAWYASVCSCYPNTLHLLAALRSFRPDIVYVWNLVGIGAAGFLDLLNCLQVPWALHLVDRFPADLAGTIPAAALGLFNAQGSTPYEAACILLISRKLREEINSMSGIAFSRGVEIVPGWADLSGVLPH